MAGPETGPEINLNPNNGEEGYESKAATRMQRRAERRLKNAEEKVVDINEDLDEVKEDIVKIDEELGEINPPGSGGRREVRLLRQKQKLLDEADELREEAEDVTENAQEKAVDRIERRADKLADRSDGLSEDQRELNRLNTKLQNPDLDPGDRADLLEEKNRLESKIDRKKARSKRAERAQEMKTLEKETRKEELLTLAELESELEALDDDADATDATPEVDGEGDVDAPTEDTDEEGTKEPEAADEEEAPEEGKKAPTLSERMNLLGKDLTKGVLEDLQDPEDVMKQVLVSAKSFLIMWLVGKGGEKAEWLSEYSGEELDLLEKGIGLKVAREGNDRTAKLNDDGGISVEWVDPEPEFLPPVKAIKIYKNVFENDNWQATPAKDISRATTMQELKDMAESDKYDETQKGQLNKLIQVITAANNGEAPGDAVKVVSFLEENVAKVKAELGVEEGGEEELDSDSIEAKLATIGLSLESSVNELLKKTDEDTEKYQDVLDQYKTEDGNKNATFDSMNISDFIRITKDLGTFEVPSLLDEVETTKEEDSAQ